MLPSSSAGGTDRVALLENEMQALRGLPDRVASLESQMVQFRAEVRAEFSATRKVGGLESRFVTKLDSKIDELRGELRTEMRALKDELGSQMRTLHKDTVARIALINRG